jgi:putative SOS response-associated peptidase YedK
MEECYGQWVKTFSILTTTPNTLTASVHDRMPVILDPYKYNLWLDPALTNANVISELLNPTMLASCGAIP